MGLWTDCWARRWVVRTTQAMREARMVVWAAFWAAWEAWAACRARVWRGPAQGGNPLLMILLQLLQQNGGIGGLMGRMQQSGMGDQVQSWIGTGENQPIAPDALSQIFGQGQLGRSRSSSACRSRRPPAASRRCCPNWWTKCRRRGRYLRNDNDLVSQVLASVQKSDALKR